jgi:hypothetical protein
MLIMKINILVLKLIQQREYAQLRESLLWILIILQMFW